MLMASRDKGDAVAGDALAPPALGVGVNRQGDDVAGQAIVGEVVNVAANHGIEADQDHRFAHFVRLDAVGV